MAQTKVLPFAAPAGVERPRQRPIDLVHLAKQTLGDSGLECEVLRMFDQFAIGTFARIERSTNAEELQAHLSSLRGAAAFGDDPRHAVHDGVLHHRRTVLGLHLVAGAVVLDIGDLGNG
jgi:hypothetical protein